MVGLVRGLGCGCCNDNNNTKYQYPCQCQYADPIGHAVITCPSGAGPTYPAAGTNHDGFDSITATPFCDLSINQQYLSNNVIKSPFNRGVGFSTDFSCGSYAPFQRQSPYVLANNYGPTIQIDNYEGLVVSGLVGGVGGKVRFTWPSHYVWESESLLCSQFTTRYARVDLPGVSPISGYKPWPDLNFQNVPIGQYFAGKSGSVGSTMFASSAYCGFGTTYSGDTRTPQATWTRWSLSFFCGPSDNTNANRHDYRIGPSGTDCFALAEVKKRIELSTNSTGGTFTTSIYWTGYFWPYFFDSGAIIPMDKIPISGSLTRTHEETFCLNGVGSPCVYYGCGSGGTSEMTDNRGLLDVDYTGTTLGGGIRTFDVARARVLDYTATIE